MNFTSTVLWGNSTKEMGHTMIYVQEYTFPLLFNMETFGLTYIPYHQALRAWATQIIGAGTWLLPQPEPSSAQYL